MKQDRGFKHISCLDGVRGLAVLAVFFHHAVNTSISGTDWPAYVRIIANFVVEGRLGVDLFFVLSGYLITTLLLKDRRKPSLYHDFYIKRAFRILPALFASLAFGYLAGYLNGATVILGLLFVSNYAHLFHIPTLGPFWSLAVEEQFYIIWPVLVRRASFRAFHRIVLGIILIEPIIRYVSVQHGHGTMYYTWVRADGLAWGAWLGASTYYHRIYADARRADVWWNRYGRWVGAVGLVAVTSYFLSLDLNWITVQRDTALFTMSPILFTGLLSYLITHPRAAIARLLSTRPLAFFGDISYGLYLVHLTVINLIDGHTDWLDRPIEPLPYVVRLIVIFGISVGTSALSLYLFERPVMRLRSRYLTRRL